MLRVKGRILCADHDDTCSRLSSVFNEFGYEVVTVRSADEARGLALTETFVLYVVDTAFHNGSGLALCSDLRFVDRLTPVILYSSSTGEEEQQAGIAAGARAYVLKPNFDHLILAVLHALPRESSMNESRKAESHLSGRAAAAAGRINAK